MFTDRPGPTFPPQQFRRRLAWGWPHHSDRWKSRAGSTQVDGQSGRSRFHSTPALHRGDGVLQPRRVPRRIHPLVLRLSSHSGLCLPPKTGGTPSPFVVFFEVFVFVPPNCSLDNFSFWTGCFLNFQNVLSGFLHFKFVSKFAFF